METVETESSDDEELPSEVEEPTPTAPIQKVAKVAKVAKFDPMSLVNKFPAIANMREEDRKLITGYNSETDKFTYSVDENSLCLCPSCERDIPDPWASCVCGVSFELNN